MINFASYTGELNAFKAGTCDWIDETILPSDYAGIAGNPAYTFGFVNAFTLDEYDLNVAVLPFSNLGYREAVTSLINVNKNAWLALELGGGGAPAYSPIACDIVANSGIAWYDSLTSTLFQTGYLGALQYLMGSGLTPIVDPYNASCFTWQFTSPFPSTGPNGEPAMSNSMVYIYARSDDVPARLDLGTELEGQCGNAFANWGAVNTASLTTYVYGLYPALTGKLPRIEVTVAPISHSTGNTWVMVDYDFEAYTGGWSLGSTPDNMELYLSEYAAEGAPWFGAVPYLPNYGSIIDTTFDNDVNSMEASLSIGSPSTVNSGMYWCYKAQMELMGNAWLIPMWYYTEYSPCLTSDYNNINEVGTGFSNWFTWLNAYPTSASPGYSSNSLTFGMRGGLLNPNIISASWLWDWYPLGVIYDSLAAGNPYNVTQLLPYLADSFNESQWLNPGNSQTDTVVNCHLRSDVWWQDLPAMDRSSFTLDGGNEINGGPSEWNMPFTALDVAFTMAYYALGNMFTSVHVGESASNIDHITISSIYQPYFKGATATPAGIPWANESYIMSVYGLPASDATSLTTFAPYIGGYESLATYENNIVQFSSSLDPYTVQIYLSTTMTWLAYYRVLGVPILPWYIFSHLALGAWPNSAIAPGFTTTDVTGIAMGPTSFQPTSANILYGTGPWIWVAQSALNTWEFIPYNDGATYGGVTEAHGYFWQPVRDADTMPLGHDAENFVTYKGGANTASTASVALTEFVQNWLPITVSVEYYFSVTYNVYTSGTWGANVSFNTPTIAATLPAATLTGTNVVLPSLTSETYYGPAITPLTALITIPKTSLSTWIILETDFVLTYTWQPNPSEGLGSPGNTQGMLAASGSYTPAGLSIWDPNQRPVPWWQLLPCTYNAGYPFEAINLAELPGDINGQPKNLVSPYPGAGLAGQTHGIVNVASLTPILTNWLAHGIPWSGITNPTDAVHRGDINADGIINVRDVTVIILTWLHSWNYGTPPAAP